MELVNPFAEEVSKGSVSEGLRQAVGVKGVMPMRSPGGGRPAGPITAALRRNRPVNPSIPTASKSGRRIT